VICEEHKDVRTTNGETWPKSTGVCAT
jgi:hypothetical protein